MSVLENFKNIPRSPYGGPQGSNVFFFLQICNEVPGEKKRGPVAPPTGDRPLSPTPGATGPCRPLGGRQGPVFQPSQQSLLNFIKFLLNFIKFLQRPKIYCDIFAEGFGNRVRIIMKFTEGVRCQFWWAMRPLKDDTRETTFHVISNYKLFCQRECLVDADFTNL